MTQRANLRKNVTLRAPEVNTGHVSMTDLFSAALFLQPYDGMSDTDSPAPLTFPKIYSGVQKQKSFWI